MTVDDYYNKKAELAELYDKHKISQYQYEEAIKHLDKVKGVKK